MSRNPYENLPTVPSFEITSTDVQDGQEFPVPYTGSAAPTGGQDISPQLAWRGFPEGTKSFVVSMYDPDAPTPSGFWHWVVADITASVTTLARGAGTPNSAELPAGAFHLPNDYRAARYNGAAPPVGDPKHAYYIAVTAVDVESLHLGHDVTPAFFFFNLVTHTLARAIMVPWFEIRSS
jgi:Raf kinase inhibitor-like YbhB/YbcL family protein